MKKIQNDVQKMEELQESLQSYAEEYDVLVFLKPIENKMSYYAMMIPNVDRGNVKFGEVEETYGVTIEEFRLAFFMKLSELRKKITTKKQ